MADLFDEMPYILVAISPESDRRIADPDDYSPIPILHVVAYPNQPSQASVDSLYQELRTDESLGLVGTDFVIRQPPDHVRDNLIEHLRSQPNDLVVRRDNPSQGKSTYLDFRPRNT